MKYGYNTETKKASIDLYSVDSDGSGGYLAIYDIADDSVHPYKEWLANNCDIALDLHQ